MIIAEYKPATPSGLCNSGFDDSFGILLRPETHFNTIEVAEQTDAVGRSGLQFSQIFQRADTYYGGSTRDDVIQYRQCPSGSHVCSRRTLNSGQGALCHWQTGF